MTITKETMDISAQKVKELRDLTGAGMMDCKRALTDAGGDMQKAVALLKERGMASAARKSEREAREGTIASYIHAGGRIGSLVELNCETDFVARTDDFQKLARDVAMQVAGLAPRWISLVDVPESAKQAKRAELESDPQTSDSVDAALQRWLKESVLLEQTFRDTNMTVGGLVTDAIARIGENIVVRRFARFQLGEDLSGEGS